MKKYKLTDNLELNDKQQMILTRCFIYPIPLFFLGFTIYGVIFLGAPLYVILVGLAVSGGIIGAIECAAKGSDRENKKITIEENNPIQNIDENVKSNINEISLEKQKYVSLLELVEKYKSLENQRHIEIPIEEDETIDIGGYTYMKK